jgi:Flp pilus assembly protein TadB
MTIKSLDDIDHENQRREREKFKEDVSTDIVDIFKKISKKSKEEKSKAKKQRSKLIKVLLFLFGFGLFIMAINFILANIWLIRFFIKSLFFSSPIPPP